MKNLLFAIFTQRTLFYGFRTLLFTELLSRSVIAGQNVGKVYGIFISSAVLLPILGGIIADRTGSLHAAKLGLSMMLIGGIALIFQANSPILLLLALIMLAVGHGIFDPAAVTCVADIGSMDKNNNGIHFRLMFFCVNMGAFIAPLIVFLTPPQQGILTLCILGIAGLLVLLSTTFKSNPNEMFKESTLPLHVKPHSNMTVGLITVNIMLALFLTQFEQIWSTFFKVTTDIGFSFQGEKLPASILVSLNPLLFMLLTPVAEFIMRRFKPSVTLKLWLAAPMMAASFIFLGNGVVESNKFHLAIFMTLITASEILILPTVYNYAANIVGSRNRASKLGLMSAGIGIGYFLSGSLSDLVHPQEDPSAYFYVMGLSFMIITSIFLWFSRKVWLYSVDKTDNFINNESKKAKNV
ncbi:MFS transporter [Dickeya chrysanthemi]|uniref:MFS transporter n=1 Tax=Dickeya chrysanthemi TaxID=556 RepID=UPI0030159432